MCYSTQSSIIAWSIALIIALYLFNRNRNYDRWNAGFIFIFTTIQLLEGGIWATQNQNINNLLTKLILIILLLQPLIQSYLGFVYTKNCILLFLSWVYLSIILYGLYRIVSSKKNDFYTNVGEGGHLVWNDRSHPTSFLSGGISIISILYFIGLFLPLLFAKNYKGLPLLITGILTALYSLYIAKKNEFSSLWCYYSVVYAIVALSV